MPSTLNKLFHLKIDRAKGAAPHKPLLLLCLLEIAEESGLSQDLMPITGELAFRFSSYWSVVAHRRPQRPDIKLPLFHMKSDGFWQPLDEYLNLLRHREMSAYIRFDPDFLKAINDPDFREQARAIIIRTYFQADEQTALWALMGKPAPPSDNEYPEELPANPEATERGREGRFRIGVIVSGVGPSQPHDIMRKLANKSPVFPLRTTFLQAKHV